jgi:phosphoglycerate dehydrogenase-like enzyme
MKPQFRVGVTRSLIGPDGTGDLSAVGLERLAAAPNVQFEILPEVFTELPAVVAREYDALVIEYVQVTPASFEGVERLALIARYGVGYENIDTAACTDNAVLVTITPDGVRRPMAVVNLTFLLALAMRLLTKDHLARENRWDEWRPYMGVGLTNRVLGLVGMGNIGAEFLKIAKPLELKYLVYDPYVSDETAATLGAQKVELETLLREADFISINCPLTPETRHLIGEQQIALMKPTAFLINTARGAIVDQKALTVALQEKRIAGAALDVFEQEPTAPDDPLLKLDNVILSPHILARTDECFRGLGYSATDSVLAVASGRVPRYVVNRAVIDDERLQAKLQRFAG